ncbi:PIG-L deacetylase family protein [Ramlibacter sp.]|uniref:PIG-L deacetylase family protein n=1 Tax=Ramlibacter sp. TaxID=1917967 RepID=UPI0017BC3EEF|nr:PIG-L deacetylase family protein [Ramlibacter sp.]MBA2673413.1 PIG-L family deacetylase [Ramlibacter sp.]
MSEGLRVPYEAAALPVPQARSVLVLAPHPDDEVFGCGGCAALYAQAGVPVQALLLTDGGLWGVPPPGIGIVEARKAEARKAAAVLGCRPPLFGPYPDRGLKADTELVRIIVRQARACGADVLLAPSPWEVHPDHVATAWAAIDAVAQLGGATCLVQYEVGSALQPNTLLDITPVWPRKREAMACFASQLAMQGYDRHVEALNVFRTYTLPATVEAAEGLRVATAQEAREDPYGLVFRGSRHPVADFIPRPRKPA